MTTEEAVAMDEARRAAAGGPVDRLLERLAEQIGARASVQAVFGEPVRQGDVTVVPVARVRWGFGGGSGSANGPTTGSGSGSGGGGGVSADPVGYLEIGPAGATFRQIAERYPSPVFLVAAGGAGAIVLRALARLVRG